MLTKVDKMLIEERVKSAYSTHNFFKLNNYHPNAECIIFRPTPNDLQELTKVTKIMYDFGLISEFMEKLEKNIMKNDGITTKSGKYFEPVKICGNNNIPYILTERLFIEHRLDELIEYINSLVGFDAFECDNSLLNVRFYPPSNDLIIKLKLKEFQEKKLTLQQSTLLRRFVMSIHLVKNYNHYQGYILLNRESLDIPALKAIKTLGINISKDDYKRVFSL